MRQRPAAIRQYHAAETCAPSEQRPATEPLPSGSARRIRFWLVVDLLAALMGSRVRADVLTAVFGISPRRFGLRDLGRATRRPHQVVAPHLRLLVGAGLVRAAVREGRPSYEPDIDAPAAREIAALVRQTRGRVPLLRRALVTLRTPSLAWAIPGPRPAQTQGFELVVLTNAPRSLVRVQLADLLPRDRRIHCMSIREWITRLDKGDVDLRRMRRARKLWIVGGWEHLIEAERSVLETRRLLRRAVTNWQEELSDDWDDAWDPFQASPTA